MDEQGWVVREPMPTDKRRVWVRLTDKSTALAQKIAPMIEDQYHQLESRLGREHVNALMTVLEQSLLHLEEK